MFAGAWKDAVITFGTDDDLTPEVDLGGYFDHVLVLVPVLENATVALHIGDLDSEDEADSRTFYPVHAFDDDATGSFAHATTADTAVKAVIFKAGCARFIKIMTGAGQSANRTFKVRGLNLA